MGAFNDFFSLVEGFDRLKQDKIQDEHNQLTNDILRQKLEFAKSTEDIEKANLQAESDLFAEKLKAAKHTTSNQQRILDDSLATNLSSRKASDASVASSTEQLLLFKDQRQVLNDNQAEAILVADDEQADMLEVDFNAETTSEGRQARLDIAREFVAKSANGKPLLALKIEQLDARDKAGTAEKNRPLAKTPQEQIIRENAEAMEILKQASPATYRALILKNSVDARGGRVVQDPLGSNIGLPGEDADGTLPFGSSVDPLTAQTDQNLSDAINKILGDTQAGRKPGTPKPKTVTLSQDVDTSDPTKLIDIEKLDKLVDPEVGKSLGIRDIFEVMSKFEARRFNPESIEKDAQRRTDSAVKPRGVSRAEQAREFDFGQPLAKGSVFKKAIAEDFRTAGSVLTNKINKAFRDGLISEKEVAILEGFNKLLAEGKDLKGNIISVIAKNDRAVDVSLASFTTAQKIAMKRIVGSSLLHKDPNKLISDLNSTTAITKDMQLIINSILRQVSIDQASRFVGPEL